MFPAETSRTSGGERKKAGSCVASPALGRKRFPKISKRNTKTFKISRKGNTNVAGIVSRFTMRGSKQMVEHFFKYEIFALFFSHSSMLVTKTHASAQHLIKHRLGDSFL